MRRRLPPEHGSRAETRIKITEEGELRHEGSVPIALPRKTGGVRPREGEKAVQEKGSLSRRSPRELIQSSADPGARKMGRSRGRRGDYSPANPALTSSSSSPSSTQGTTRTQGLTGTPMEPSLWWLILCVVLLLSSWVVYLCSSPLLPSPAAHLFPSPIHLRRPPSHPPSPLLPRQPLPRHIQPRMGSRRSWLQIGRAHV